MLNKEGVLSSARALWKLGLWFQCVKHFETLSHSATVRSYSSKGIVAHPALSSALTALEASMEKDDVGQCGCCLASLDTRPLNSDLLASMQQGGGARFGRRCTRRVKVYTLSGVQIGLPGVGEGDHDLTFPADWLIAEALEQKHWIRRATAEELQQDAKWWRFIDRAPKALISTEAGIMFEFQTMGWFGDVLTAIQEAPEQSWEDKSCDDLSDVPTPPTPP